MYVYEQFHTCFILGGWVADRSGLGADVAAERSHRGNQRNGRRAPASVERRRFLAGALFDRDDGCADWLSADLWEVAVVSLDSFAKNAGSGGSFGGLWIAPRIGMHEWSRCLWTGPAFAPFRGVHDHVSCERRADRLRPASPAGSLPMSAKQSLSSFVLGALFGTGLLVSGMVNPQKVQDFLDVSGNFDPSLALVMGGAVLVTFLSFPFILRRQKPVLGQKFHLPTSQDLDAKLIVGGLLFGSGWGLAGYCPGPAIVAFASGSTSALLFVVSMLLGMALHRTYHDFRNPIP